MKRRLTGSGGDAPPPPHVPVESANTLQSKATYRVLDLVSHGEIEGLFDGNKSIYLDGVPLEDGAGNPNFDGVTVDYRYGAVSQAPVQGFPEVETPKSTGLPISLLYNDTVTRVIPSSVAAGLDAIRILLSIPAMYQQETNGDVNGSSVTVSIAIDNTVVREVTLTGKCTSTYEKTYRIPIVPTGYDISISLTRTSVDAPNPPVEGDPKIVNTIYWASWTEITDHRFEYPSSAYFAGTVEANLFGGKVPVRSYDIKGIKVSVPLGYTPPQEDPITGVWSDAVYPGLWDGTFDPVKRWTSNPAWIFYDLVTNTEYGAGIQDTGSVLKWSLYPIAQYCDVLIDSGLGVGVLEPRFQLNCVIDSLHSAYSLIGQLSSTFRGMTWWAANSVDVSMDAPADPQILVTPSNVIGGSFRYEGTDRKVRNTVALVTWNDPGNQFIPTIEAVEDSAAIARFGYNKTDIAPFGCTTQGQAHRAGRWLLDTEQSETETVTYTAGLDHAFVTPGMIIAVADPFVINTALAADPSTADQARIGGRVYSATGSTVIIDQSLVLNVANTYNLYCVLPSGAVESRQVLSWVAGARTSLLLQSSFSSDPAVGAVWIITGTSASPRLFRVLSKTENKDDSGKVTYTIVALFHDSAKYARVEQNLYLTPPSYTSQGTTGVILPPNNVTSHIGTYYTDGLLRNLLVVSWRASTDERVNAYRVRYKFGLNNWVDVGLIQGFSYELLDIREGTYIFEVRSVARTGGAESIGVSTTLVVTQLQMPDVTGLHLLNTAFDTQPIPQPISTQYVSGAAEFAWDRTNLSTMYAQWVPGTYEIGATVSNAGKRWVALAQTALEPADGVSDWEYRGVTSDIQGEELWFDSYRVVIDPLGVNAVHTVRSNEFVYTQEMNSLDHAGTPSRSFTIHVYQVGCSGQLSSTPAELTVDNPAPSMALFSPTVTGSFMALAVQWEAWGTPDTDFASFKVYCDTNPDPQTLVQELLKGTRRTFIPDLVADVTYYVKLVPTDQFGDGIASSVSAGMPVVITAVDPNLELTQSVTITDFSSDNHAQSTLDKLYDRRYLATDASVTYTITGGEWIRYAYNIEDYIDRVVIYAADSNARVYVRFSSDGVTWTYLKGYPDHGLSPRGEFALAVGADEAAKVADAELNYWQLSTGVNAASFPQNVTAKYCELWFVGAYTTGLRELKFVREVIAEQVVAENLAAISAVTGVLSSLNYVPNSTGYLLDGDAGAAYFNDMTIRVQGWGTNVFSNLDDLPAPNATANSDDATLLDLSNSTGTIPYSSVWGGPPANATANSTDADLLMAAADYADAKFLSAVTYDADIAALQAQIDGSLETWFYPGVPTLLNEPAVNWNTTTLRDRHLGDLYYDNTSGVAYRFVLNATYEWIVVTDTALTSVLALAQSAQDTADNKRRVFVSTPVVPYDVGDLWSDSTVPTAVVLRRCLTAKTNLQAYNIADWGIISDITSQNTANDTVNVNGVSAATVRTNAQNAATSVANMSADSVFSVQEKATWRIQWAGMSANYTNIIAQATTYGIQAESVFTTYVSNRNSLYNYLNNDPHDIYGLSGGLGPTTDTPINGDILILLTANYYDSMQLAVNRLADYQTYANLVGTKPPTNADSTLVALQAGTTITGGGVTVSNGGYFRGGKADYTSSTSGFFMGYSGGAYKFAIGSSANYIKWDGTTLTIAGTITVTGSIADSIAAAQTTANNAASTATTAVSTANTASSTATTAQSTANTALSTANGAYPYNSVTVTNKGITLTGTAYVRSGLDNWYYNGQTGFYLGYTSAISIGGVYYPAGVKFTIGNATTGMWWNSNANRLELVGDLVAAGNVKAGTLTATEIYGLARINGNRLNSIASAAVYIGGGGGTYTVTHNLGRTVIVTLSAIWDAYHDPSTLILQSNTTNSFTIQNNSSIYTNFLVTYTYM